MYKGLNICVLGPSQVGKSCIISSFVSGSYEKSHIPTIENKTRKILQLNKKVFNIYIHDTASLIELNCLVQDTISQCDSFVIVFSLDDERSSEKIQYYKNLIHTTLALKKTATVPIVIAANKLDTKVNETQVVNQKIKKIKKLYKIPVIECTSKDTDTTNLVFKELIKQIEKKNDKKQKIPNVNNIKIYIKNKFKNNSNSDEFY